MFVSRSRMSSSDTCLVSPSLHSRWTISQSLSSAVTTGFDSDPPREFDNARAHRVRAACSGCRAPASTTSFADEELVLIHGSLKPAVSQPVGVDLLVCRRPDTIGDYFVGDVIQSASATGRFRTPAAVPHPRGAERSSPTDDASYRARCQTHARGSAAGASRSLCSLQ